MTSRSTCLLGAVLASAVACSPAEQEPDDPPSEPQEATQGETGQAPESPWSAEGLVDPLRSHFSLPEGLPDEWEPGPTAWDEVEVPPQLQQDTASFSSPKEVLLAYVSGPEEREGGLGQDIWETTLRILPHDEAPDRATGAVLVWGFKDDALEGRDVRLELREGEEGWYATEKEHRYHCRRGVTDDDLCR